MIPQTVADEVVQAVETASTVPIKKPETAVLADKPLNVEGSYVYDWKRGKTMFLSKREELIADTFLKTRNYSECSRVVSKEGREISSTTCRRWLERPWVSGWLEEKVKERGIASGWTKERWMIWAHEHMVGEKKLKGGDMYMMNLIAKVQGFGSEASQVQNLTQINITQANGMK